MPDIAFPKQVLADWCREDGHVGCAVAIEESPDLILPSVLWWVAKHAERHVIYDDDDANALPSILREEALAIRSRRGCATLTDRTAAVTLGAIFLIVVLLDAVWR